VKLEGIPIPGEEAAEERAWEVLRSCFAERTPAPRERRLWRPALVLAVVAVLAGVVASPPGRAVLTSVREAVGVKKAEPALFSLPAPGRLLVLSEHGPWILQSDGSKRLLGRYRDAAWSPFGRFVAATQPNELVTLDPKGNVRWTLARRDVRFPRWAGTRVDTRIAYLTGPQPRIVAGDGTNDRGICFTLVAPVAPVWRPGADRTLAVVGRNRAVYALDVDGCKLQWRSLALPEPQRLEWSSDGTRLLVLTPNGVVVLREGRPLLSRAAVVDAAFRPGTHEIAVIRRRGGSSELVLGSRVLFRGTGEFRELAWSPDARWLLVTWPTANQWVFVRATGPRKIFAVSGIIRQFGGGEFPRIAGWCCAR
jgi:hypothetical protein